MVCRPTRHTIYARHRTKNHFPQGSPQRIEKTADLTNCCGIPYTMADCGCFHRPYLCIRNHPGGSPPRNEGRYGWPRSRYIRSLGRYCLHHWAWSALLSKSKAEYRLSGEPHPGSYRHEAGGASPPLSYLDTVTPRNRRVRSAYCLHKAARPRVWAACTAAFASFSRPG